MTWRALAVLFVSVLLAGQVLGDLQVMDPPEYWPEGIDGIPVGLQYSNTERCVACRTIAEEFAAHFMGVLHKHKDRFKAGPVSASYEYDQTTHDLVMQNCNRNQFQTVFAPYIREMCHELMADQYRPKLLAPYVNNPIQGSLNPVISEGTNTICVNTFGLCPAPTPTPDSISRRCSYCRVIADDLEYLVQRLRPTATALDVGDAIGTVCGGLLYRHHSSEVSKLADTCSGYMDEYDDKIIKIFSKRSGPAEFRSDELCVKLTKSCKPSQPRADL